MTSVSKDIRQLIKERIGKKDPSAELILFGSRSRGDAHAGSDWDILILLNLAEVTRETEKMYRNEIVNVEIETGEPISTYILSKQTWESKFASTPFYENVIREGIRL